MSAIRLMVLKGRPLSSLRKREPPPTTYNCSTKACTTWPNSTDKRQESTSPPYLVPEPQAGTLRGAGRRTGRLPACQLTSRHQPAAGGQRFSRQNKRGRSDHYRRGTCRPTDPDGKSSGRRTERVPSDRHSCRSDSRTNCRRRRTTCCRILPCTRHYPSRHAPQHSHAKAYSPRKYPPGNGAAFKKLE